MQRFQFTGLMFGATCYVTATEGAMIDFHDASTQAMIQSFVALVTAAATIALTLLTARYVRLTGSMLEEARTSRGPNLYVDLEVNYQDEVKLIVGNSGQSPAHRITFHVIDPLHWSQIQHCKAGFNSVDVVRDGVSYIAPGRALKYEVGILTREDVKADNSTVEFRINYIDHLQAPREITFNVNMLQYASVLYESFTGPESNIVRAIEKSQETQFLRNRVHSWLSGSR